MRKGSLEQGVKAFMQVKEALQFDTLAGTEVCNILRVFAFRGLRAQIVDAEGMTCAK